jgi:DJ-1 family protein
MKTALVFLVTGFEEVEALTSVDILRRGGIDVKTVSLEKEKTVKSKENIPIIADLSFKEVENDEVDMLILPGGTLRIADYPELNEKIKKALSFNKQVGAICAAPVVLGRLGLLKGKRATVYPGFEQELKGATVTKEAVVIDGNIITARGPGLATEFALTLLERLAGKEIRNKIAKEFLVD